MSFSTHHIEVLETSAWKEFAEKKYSSALLIFEKLLEKDPESVAAYQGSIACYRKLLDFKNAGEILQTALKKFPKEPGILSENAWFYFEQNDYDNAIKAFDDFLSIKKDDIGIFLWQIYLLRHQRYFKKIREVINEAKTLFPNNETLLIEEGWMLFYLLRLEERQAIFSSVLQNNPSHEIALQGKIACLRMQRKFTEALFLAEKASLLVKDSPGIYSEKGWINIELENYPEAENNFKAVLMLVKNDGYAHINLAWALSKQGSENDYAAATAHCNKALAINPDLPEAWGCLGNIAFKRGNIKEAETCFLQSIEKDSQRGCYCDLGALYLQMERYDEAKEMLDAALKLNTDDAYARLEMGYFYLYTNKLKDAAREFKRSIILDANNPETFRALAIALMEDNNMMEAERVLRRAINQYDGKHCNGLHITLAQLLIKCGDQGINETYYKDALKEIQIATKIKPDNPSNYFYNGILRFKLEDYSTALTCFRQCLDFDKHFIEAELNSIKIQDILQRNKTLVKFSKFPSIFLTIVFLAQLILVWVLYLKTEKITVVTVSVLVPILSGLLIISILLPWLSKFKMSGIEAELNAQNPKDNLATGPKGEMILVTALSKL